MIEQFVRVWAQAIPEKRALTTPERPWTYEQLDAVVEDLRARLGTMLPPGETVALLVTPQGEAVAALLAAERSGYPVVLLSPELPLAEIESSLVSSRSSLLIVPSLAVDKANRLGLPQLMIAGSQFQYAPVPEVSPRARILNPRAHSDVLPPGISICQLTSGSTGPSRLAVRAREGIGVEVQAVAERLDLRQSDRVLCASSIAHSYGLVAGLLAPLSAGAEVALAQDQTQIPRMIEDLEPTIVVGLGATYRACLDQLDDNRGLAGTRFLLSAGAPLSDTVFTAFLQHFGFPIRQDYGTTETGTIAIDASSDPAPSVVGIPLPHLDVRLGPKGPMTEFGRETEVQVRSLAVASGYLVNGAIFPCVDETGWYHTMDAGKIDYAGRLSLQGRFRESLWIEGHAVSPEAIEAVIASLRGVQEVIVVPDETAGNRGIKAVVVAPGCDTGIIRHWCKSKLPAAQVPGRIELRIELPRSPAGKVLQKYL